MSETKRAESELHESERKYSTIVEKGNDSVIIIQDKEIKFANSKVLDMSGYTREEIIGNSLLKYIPEPDHRKCVEWFENRTANGNSSNIISVNILTKDNREIPTEINVSIIEYEGKDAELLIIRDISERKHARIFSGKKRKEWRITWMLLDL
ncbi:MAG: PAS domain S-box protein [Methanolobus sp.]